MKELLESEVFREYAKGPDVGAYDFYRCARCGWLFTREHELRTFKDAEKLDIEHEYTVHICPCGSRRYNPARVPEGLTAFQIITRRVPKKYRMVGWDNAAVRRYTLKLVVAREVAPWLERHRALRSLLPLAERMVAFEGVHTKVVGL